MKVKSKRPRAKGVEKGGRVRVRVMFEYIDFLHFDFGGIYLGHYY